MAEKFTIQSEEQSQTFQMEHKKIDGKLIVDEYQALERILNRMDTIWSAYYDTVNDPSALWCDILNDVGYSAIEELQEILDNIKKKSTVVEYIQNLEKNMAVNCNRFNIVQDS